MKLRNKGISLAGAMVAVGIMAAAAVMGTKITQQNAKTTKAAKNSLDLNSKSAQITSRLLKKGVCSSMLVGESVNYDIPPAKSEGVNGIGLALNKKVSGTSLITREIKFISKGSNTYAIKVRFEKDLSDQSYGAKEIVREFPISVSMSGVTVTGCHSDAVDLAVEKTCDMLGGTILSTGDCSVNVKQLAADLASLKALMAGLDTRLKKIESIKSYSCPVKGDVTLSCKGVHGMITKTKISSCKGQSQKTCKWYSMKCVGMKWKSPSATEYIVNCPEK